jgi:hypothetical protein
MKWLSRFASGMLPRAKNLTSRAPARRARLAVKALEDRQLLSGVVTEFPTPLSDPNGKLGQVTLGSDGNYW